MDLLKHLLFFLLEQDFLHLFDYIYHVILNSIDRGLNWLLDVVILVF